MIALRPGISATIYGNLPRDLDSPLGRDVIRASDIVTLHTSADPTDVRSAALVRQINPAARVWLACPANYLSRMDLAKGREAVLAEVRRIASVAVAMGAEVVELNGEGSSDGKTPGDWTSAADDLREAERLESLGRDVMLSLRATLPASCAIAWTSHDGTSFRVPRALLSRVDLHSPQHYPAEAGRTVSQRELERRVAWSEGQWHALAERGRVPAEVVPHGARWVPYLQGWGHTVGAMVWGLVEAPIARLWACPGSWSPEALTALRYARMIRDAAGHGPGAIERWQRGCELAADGILGPRSLATLEHA